MRLAAAFSVLSIMMLGCGGGADIPDVGFVEGTVTLDGKPLAGAVLVFQPEHARPSYGRTDAEGHYELFYTDEAKGATIGKHSVKITREEGATAAQGDDGDDGEGGYEDSGRGAETIPAKYNTFTELTYDVVAGSQTKDWALESGGEIVQESGYGN